MYRLSFLVEGIEEDRREFSNFDTAMDAFTMTISEAADDLRSDAGILPVEIRLEEVKSSYSVFL